MPREGVSETGSREPARGLAAAGEVFGEGTSTGVSRGVEVSRSTVWEFFRSLLRGIAVFIARVIVFIQGLL